MNTPKPAPLAVEGIAYESESEYLLRCAAAYISAYCPDQHILMDNYDEESTGQQLTEDILSQLKSMEEQRHETARSIEFYGSIIQAGGDTKDPTVTITTSRRALSACATIPFYQDSTIRVTPIKR